jgi:hypothetical protein
MILLAILYLYKFHLKPGFNKLGSMMRPQLLPALQPIATSQNRLVNALKDPNINK